LKKLHIESDLVFQSEQGALRITTNDQEVHVNFDDWNTLSFFFKSVRLISNPDLGQIKKLTRNIDQLVAIQIKGESIVTIGDGKIRKWKLIPAVKLLWLWLF